MRVKWQATESKIAESDDTVIASLRELHAALNAMLADGNYNLVHDIICLPSFKTFTAIWNSGSAEEDNARQCFGLTCTWCRCYFILFGQLVRATGNCI